MMDDQKMVVELKVISCGGCPFGTRDIHSRPACGARIYLEPENREWAVPFDVRGEVGGDWDFVYPGVPPDWCPIRAEPVMITLEDSDG